MRDDFLAVARIDQPDEGDRLGSTPRPSLDPQARCSLGDQKRRRYLRIRPDRPNLVLGGRPRNAGDQPRAGLHRVECLGSGVRHGREVDDAFGLPPGKWPSLKYGFSAIGGRENAAEEAQA